MVTAVASTATGPQAVRRGAVAVRMISPVWLGNANVACILPVSQITGEQGRGHQSASRGAGGMGRWGVWGAG